MNSSDRAAALLKGPFRLFPPGRQNIWVPTRSRKSARAGLSIYTACRPSAVALHEVIWRLVGLVGTTVLWGTERAWWPPMDVGRWAALVDAWTRDLGSFDSIAVYQRPQASRRGLALVLLRDGVPVAFVKSRPYPETLAQEHKALTALEQSPSAYFSTPTPLADGKDGDWSWLAMTALPACPHRPVPSPPLAQIIEDIQETLAPALDRGSAPAHWLPMHGDLTVWNLRLARRRPWLFDWEDSGFGPPGADATYYGATLATISGEDPGLGDHEAIKFWEDRVLLRPETDGDRAFNVGLARAFLTMRGGS